MKEKIFKNFSLKVLSALCAIVLWAIIVNVYDPTISVTISNVPVELVNTESLTRNNYSFEIVEGQKINVYIKGPKSIVANISSSDIQATADLSKITAFADYVDIEVKVVKNDRDVNNIEVLPRTTAVRLEIENKVVKELEVKYDVEGNPSDGCVVSGVNIEPSTIRIAGPSSVIEKIMSAKISCDVSDAKANISGKAVVSLYDLDGNVVEDDMIEYDKNELSYDVDIDSIKTVPVKCAGVKGSPSNGYHIQKYSVSVSQIDIVGKKEELDKISQIVIPAEAIDVTGLSSNKSVTINLNSYVNSKVKFRSNSSVIVTVNVVYEDVKTIDVDMDDIKCNNLKSGYKVELMEDDKISIKVSGNSEENGSIDKKKISVSVDFAGLDEGEHTLDLKVTVPDGYRVIDNCSAKFKVTKIEQQSSTEASTQ